MTVLQTLYDKILRDRLPRKLGVYGGVVVRAPYLLDQTDVKPEWEDEYLTPLSENIESGDQVVLVGGGFGTSTVVSARASSPDGAVTVFEGSQEQVNLLTEAVALNGVENAVTVRHGVVGDPKRLFSPHEGAAEVSPKNLPECDILGLDCEGSEVEILEELSIQPRVVVVEYHPTYGATEDRTRGALESNGYDCEVRPHEELSVGIMVGRRRDAE